MIPTSEFNIADMIDRIYQFGQPWFNAMAPWVYIILGMLVVFTIARVIIDLFKNIGNNQQDDDIE